MPGATTTTFVRAFEIPIKLSIIPRTVPKRPSAVAPIVAEVYGRVLVYFGYPQAHEDDAERAVQAGLDLITAAGGLKTHAPLQMRVGIATGLVVVGDRRHVDYDGGLHCVRDPLDDAHACLHTILAAHPDQFRARSHHAVDARRVPGNVQLLPDCIAGCPHLAASVCAGGDRHRGDCCWRSSASPG